MKKNIVLLVGLIGYLAVLSACGPSPETVATQMAQAATSTAAAWTPTPTPTITPTATPTATPTPTLTPTLSPTPTRDASNGRYQETAGDFSYIPPEGWQAKEIPGFKYKMMVGPIIEKFGTNLLFLDEAYSGTLETYVALNLKTIPKLYPGLKILSQKPFVTDAGLPAIKVVIDAKMNNIKVRQTYYFFDGGDKKYVGVYSRTPTGKHDDVDALVDACMATFRVEK